VLTVRAYRASDRDVVREIVHATGFMGDSAACYWRDAESFAEVWTPYYTDVEPESLFVAEAGGTVVGYLTGCVDSRRAPNPRSAILEQMVRRQLLFRPGTAGFFWRSIGDALRNPKVPSGELSDPRWPSHLHINLLPAGRGRGAGRRLMEAWFARLREVGSPGCHLGTLAENTNAITFFQKAGFERYGPPILVPGLRLPSGARMHQQLMVRSLEPVAGRAAEASR
jgi:ribosomal protein S18 acetylase RimI-like enzyme